MNLRSFAKDAARRASRWLPTRIRPAILMYHRLGSDPLDPWGLCVSRDRFARQLQWLALNRTVMPLGEFVERQVADKLTTDAVALTFDDGYASIMAAVPPLEEIGFQATVFVPTELIGQKRAFWWDELLQIVIRGSADCLPLGGSERPVPQAHPRDGHWPPQTPPRTPRQKLFHSVWSELRTKPPAEIGSVISSLRKFSPASRPGDDRPLSPDEIRSLHTPAIEFGSHALNHPYLPALAPKAKQREIKASVEQCLSLTGRAPTAFSYPYGVVDVESMGLVESAGFRCACATGNAFVTARSDRFALPRQYVGDWEPARLGDMLGGP